MEKFAFILHPLSLQDMEHLSPLMRYIPDPIIEACLKMKKPFKVSHILASRVLMPKPKAGLSAVR